MSNKKISKLKNLTDEVKELHPMLKNLFKEIPQISNLEYTHGTNEMGADFVLAKHDEILSDYTYIGIIAKIGKVVQDLSEIERQIEECRISRTFRCGKDRIRINEIWIIVTENISFGAQRKINEKYSNSNIQFIDGLRLEKMINKYCPSIWINVDFEVSQYLTNTRRNNDEIDKALSLLPHEGSDVYIEPIIYKEESNDYDSINSRNRKRKKIDIYETIESNKFVFVEGQMGSGKSKLLRRIVNYYSDFDVFMEKKHIPIIMSYKEFNKQYDGDIEKCISDNVGEDIIKIEEKEKIHYVILLDAVDENEIETDEIIEKFKALIQQVEKEENLHVVITSRDFNNIVTEILSNNNTVFCELSPLTMKQIISFLSEICEKLKITSRIIEDIKHSPLFKELPRSPISAILLAKLLNENSEDLPSNMTELYSKYMELTLGRWDIKKGLQSQKEYQALENICMEFAQYTIDNEIPAISIDEAFYKCEEYLKVRNLGIEVDKIFQIMQNRCELLFFDKQKNILSFKHRTFAEYLYAKSKSKERKLTINTRAFDIYWSNVYFFYIGILKDCPTELQKLIDYKLESTVHKMWKIINMAEYFLAAYTTPYSIIQIGLQKIIIEAAVLFNEIISNKHSSYFSDFSRMNLIGFFQFLIRKSYSYKFLKEAMENAALSIEESDLPLEVKAYSLFFLNVAYIDTDSDESFDFLLERVNNSLPLDLSMALHFEFKNVKKQTKLMKKQEKHFKKTVKGNRALQSQIQNLFEKSTKIYFETYMTKE